MNDYIRVTPMSFGVEERKEASAEATKRGKGLRMEVHSSHTEFYADASVPIGSVAVYAAQRYKHFPEYETTLSSPEDDWMPRTHRALHAEEE